MVVAQWWVMVAWRLYAMGFDVAAVVAEDLGC